MYRWGSCMLIKRLYSFNEVKKNNTLRRKLISAWTGLGNPVLAVEITTVYNHTRSHVRICVNNLHITITWTELQ